MPLNYNNKSLNWSPIVGNKKSFHTIKKGKFNVISPHFYVEYKKKSLNNIPHCVYSVVLLVFQS